MSIRTYFPRCAAIYRNAGIQRVAPSKDAGIALLSAIFFMVLVAGLSVVMLSVILSQAAPALIAQKSTRTVYAAQAGLQTALGLIRSAAAELTPAGQEFGDPEKLPCEFVGDVGGGETGTRYEVTIAYFETDPTDQTTEWREDSANRLACDPDTGVAEVPRFAFVKSAGRDLPIVDHADTYGDRALSAVYKFKVSNVNIEGGPIYSQHESHCLQAVALESGSLIRFVHASLCESEDPTMIDLHSWVYTADYQLQLATEIPSESTGLCITGPTVFGDASAEATLTPCVEGDSSWNQLWNWTGRHSWEGATEYPFNQSVYCLSPGGLSGSGLDDQPLRYVKRGSTGEGCQGQFAPSSKVGAGAASYNTHQIVNYQEFGRCTDVTGENINAGYMISYPCKQDTTGTGTNILWNHKWHYIEPTAPAPASEEQHIWVHPSNTSTEKRCLTPKEPSGVSDLIFTSCTEDDEKQHWIRVQDTGDYISSYLFKDYQGRCMFTNPGELHDDVWSYVQVTPDCDGSLAQKWNAPPTYVESTFGGYREIPG